MESQTTNIGSEGEIGRFDGGTEDVLVSDAEADPPASTTPKLDSENHLSSTADRVKNGGDEEILENEIDTIRRILRTEPQFEIGVPSSERWTCNICRYDFPLFEGTPIGRHVYRCIEAVHNVKIRNFIDAISKKASVPPVSNSNTEEKIEKDASSVERELSDDVSSRCHYCKKTFNSKSELTTHRSLAHPSLNIPASCRNCSKQYKNKYQLHTHLKRCSPQSFTCGRSFLGSQCELQFKTIQELEKHKKKVHTNQCNVCLVTFSTQQIIYDHQTKVHPPDSNYFQCAICSKKFLAAKSIRNHIRVCISSIKNSGDGFSTICNVCDEPFDSKARLQRHYAKYFPNVSGFLSKTVTPKCLKCGKLFTTKLSMKKHLALCSKKKAKHCSVCQERVLNLTHHMMRVHEQLNLNPQECEHCRRSFIGSGSLRRHRRRCNQKKPEEPLPVTTTAQEIVPSRRCNSENLNVKSGKGISLANEQNYSPATSSVSQTQVSDIVGAEHFTCKVCSKTFSTDRQRVSHEFVHCFQSKLLKCSHCSKTYSYKARLTAHVAKAHTDEDDLSKGARNKDDRGRTTRTSLID